ncbi:MAG: SecDF P1 head subdomain-containing protein [Fluviicola sp.]
MQAEKLLRPSLFFVEKPVNCTFTTYILNMKLIPLFNPKQLQVCFGFFLTVLLFSCGSGSKPPGKPGNLQFFETYNTSEIYPSWQAACDWVNANDSLALQGKVSLSDMNSQGLGALVHPNGNNMVGYVYKEDISKVNQFLALPDVKKNFFKELRFMWSYKAQQEENGREMYALYAVKMPPGNKSIVSGKNIVNAEIVESYNGSPAISIQMNDQGSHDWEIMTTKNVGRAIAIALNDQVLSCPVVYNAIAGGATEISGNFTEEEAEELAASIYAGRK